MTRNATFFASFAATLAVAIPAAWHFLDADIRSDGKRMRGLDHEVTIGDAKVTMAVDKSLIMDGDAVSVKLAATAPTAHDVTVEMTVYHAQVRWGERVEPAQIPIDHEKIVLHATPDGSKVKETRVTLATRGAKRGTSENYRIFVAGPGVKPDQNRGETIDAKGEAVDATAFAAVGVLAWSGNTVPIRIEPVGALHSDAPFTIAVHIKNTHKHPMPVPSVELGTQISADGGIQPDEDAFEIANVDEQPANTIETEEGTRVPAGKEIVQKFTITPKRHLSSITLAASAFAWSDIGRPEDGAMDARTFTLTEGTPAVAAKD